MKQKPKVGIFANIDDGTTHWNEVIKALGCGFRRHGISPHPILNVFTEEEYDVVFACQSPRFEEFLSSQRELNRGKTKHVILTPSRVSKQGICPHRFFDGAWENGRLHLSSRCVDLQTGKLLLPDNPPDHRKMLFDMEWYMDDWKSNGPWISIIDEPNNPYFPDWCDETTTAIQQITNAPIQTVDRDNLDWSETQVAVAMQTDTSMVTILKGIPTHVSSPAVLAAPMSTDLERILAPYTPDRSQWLCHLANSHWDNEDIRHGRYWNYLKKVI